jgi:hypothetical protein
MIDVVIPAHEKDIDTLELAIEKVIENVNDIGEVYVISRDKMTNKARWIPENSFSFSLGDVDSIIGTNRRTSWYYAMLLKMLAPVEIPNVSDKIVIMESDTLLLKPTSFIEEGNISLHSVSYDSNPPNNSYCEHITKLLPDFKFENDFSGIVHHAVAQRDIIENMIEKVESLYKMPFWKACLEITLQEYRTNLHHVSTGEGCGRMADYEILFHYPNFYFNDRVRIRPLKQIMAYKGDLGVSGFLSHRVDGKPFPSRTNLWGNQVIIPEKIQKSFKFNCIRKAMRQIGEITRDLGWDMITFQGHTRVERDLYTKSLQDSLERRLKKS